MNTTLFESPDLENLKAAITPVQSDDTMSEAGRKILLHDFVKMLKNEAGSRTGEDIEYVHDMRVSTRRMRSAFRLLGDYYKTKPIRPLVEHLKKLADHLGAVRDLDVMILDLEKIADTFDEAGKAQLQVVIERFDKKRRKARKKLVEFLDGASYRGFVSAFSQFLLQPGMGARPQSDDTIEPREVRHVLPIMLHEHLGAVKAYDSALSNADAETLHALRIEFKRLRYTASFFSEVLGSSGEDFVTEIKTIQDHLGRINDIVVTQAHLTTLIDEDGIESDALTHYLTTLQTEREQLETAFPSVWQRFNTRSVQSKLANALLTLR